MSTSATPSDWKSSIITPVFKKGSSNDPSNYRQIAFICMVSKIMGGCIKMRSLLICLNFVLYQNINMGS